MNRILPLFLLVSAAACADPPRPPPDEPRAPTPKPPALFDALPMGAAWPRPVGGTEPLPPADLPSNLEDKPVVLHPKAACRGNTVASAAADVAFPLATEDAITAAVAYGQRLEARFLREGFTDSAAGGSILKDALFRDKAEGTYQSSFAWNERVRTLRVHCADKKCDVTVTEGINACPDGAPQRAVGAP